MRLRGFHADSKGTGYFLAALALGQQLNDFAFARRQAFPGDGLRLEKLQA